MKASVFIALLVFALTAPGGWSLPDFCLQHHPTGEICTAPITRFYYNSRLNECQTFSYHKDCSLFLGHPKNNFTTLEECKSVCHLNVTTTSPPPVDLNPPNEVCHQPRNGGKITFIWGSSVLRYFYNSTSHKCQTFSYTGSGGNDNNFLTLESCRNACAYIEETITISPSVPTTTIVTSTFSSAVPPLITSSYSVNTTQPPDSVFTSSIVKSSLTDSSSDVIPMTSSSSKVTTATKVTTTMTTTPRLRPSVIIIREVTVDQQNTLYKNLYLYGSLSIAFVIILIIVLIVSFILIVVVNYNLNRSRNRRPSAGVTNPHVITTQCSTSSSSPSSLQSV